MREILFRGKRLDNGEWVEGYFANETCDGLFSPMYEQANIIIKGSGWWVPVDPATVGQFTGEVDKNGKRVFEGDLFQDDDTVCVVIFKSGCFRLEWRGITGTRTESGYDECGGGWGIVDCEPIDYWYIKDMEVIGNIHDNPKLLEGGGAHET